MTEYNKATFKTTHSSYSGGSRKSINFQLNSKIRCIEYDIHNSSLNSFDKRLLKFDFRLGHNKPDEEVAFDEDNPRSTLLGEWLGHLMNWSNLNPAHEPIALCLDIKEDLVDNSADLNLKVLNSIISSKLNGKLYTHREHLRKNNGYLAGTYWPSVQELTGRIIIFLTGDHFTKWVYWSDLPIREQYCFVAYSFEDDGGKDYSLEMLKEAKFVNCHLKYWSWGRQLFQQGKIVRLWDYNPYNDGSGKYRLPSDLNREGLLCNYPATDHPFEEWYYKAFNYTC